MNIDFTGLKNYKKIKHFLKQDAKALIELTKNTKRHLPDVISIIRTTISSLEIKAKYLEKERENKYESNER